MPDSFDLGSLFYSIEGDLSPLERKLQELETSRTIKVSAELDDVSTQAINDKLQAAIRPIQITLDTSIAESQLAQLLAGAPGVPVGGPPAPAMGPPPAASLPPPAAMPEFAPPPSLSNLNGVEPINGDPTYQGGPSGSAGDYVAPPGGGGGSQRSLMGRFMLYHLAYRFAMDQVQNVGETYELSRDIDEQMATNNEDPGGSPTRKILEDLKKQNSGAPGFFRRKFVGLAHWMNPNIDLGELDVEARADDLQSAVDTETQQERERRRTNQLTPFERKLGLNGPGGELGTGAIELGLAQSENQGAGAGQEGRVNAALQRELQAINERAETLRQLGDSAEAVAKYQAEATDQAKAISQEHLRTVRRGEDARSALTQYEGNALQAEIDGDMYGAASMRRIGARSARYLGAAGSDQDEFYRLNELDTKAEAAINQRKAGDMESQTAVSELRRKGYLDAADALEFQNRMNERGRNISPEELPALQGAELEGKLLLRQRSDIRQIEGRRPGEEASEIDRETDALNHGSSLGGLARRVQQIEDATLRSIDLDFTKGLTKEGREAGSLGISELRLIQAQLGQVHGEQVEGNYTYLGQGGSEDTKSLLEQIRDAIKNLDTRARAGA